MTSNELHIECTAYLSRDEHHSLRMGERATGRVSLLAGLLLVSLLVGFSSAQTANVSLETSLNQPVGQTWYTPAQPMTMSTFFSNSGSATSFDNDPSCDIILNVYDSEGVQVHDGSDECRGLSRGIDLFAGETKEMNALSWDMKNEQGSWQPSGFYTVEAFHPSTGLNDSTTVRIQTPVIVPDELEYTVMMTHRTAETSGPMVSIINLNNPTTQSVDVSSAGPCSMEIEIGTTRSIGMACFAGVDLIMPGEQLFIGHILTDALSQENITISTPGGSYQYSFSPQESQAETSSVEAALSINWDGRELMEYTNGEALALSVDMVSSSEAAQTLQFTTTCKAELWILDDFGEVVFDSRAENPCQDIDLEMELSPNGPLNFALPQWGFFKADGCLVSPGKLTVIVELPQYGLSTSSQIQYVDLIPNPCDSQSSLTFTPTITPEGETSLSLSSSFENTQEEHFLRMVNPCTYTLTFIDQNQDVAYQLQTLCDDYSGRKLLLPPGSQNAPFSTVSVAMVQEGMPLLLDGAYTLEIALESSPRAIQTLQFDWPMYSEQSSDEPISNSPVETFELMGTWNGLLTEQGTCWVLNTEGEQYLLSHARNAGQWQPTSEVEGIYIVHIESASPACQTFNAPSVAVLEVQLEQLPEVADEDTATDAQMDSPGEETIPAPVVAAVSVVVTTSLLSLMFIVAASNESLRIPSTLAGLWFLGLLGKTHETTDGRYQRGRLMGYLTANPGCHFRALMAALDMSNGQITHHLRILENEENVWRKKDGRLVRFYPFTNQLHPNMIEEDLPVPPLSPDPNSLQGKILSLLDEDGQLGGFPTQAELAKRLEKSQQLISHHLRTLQKYGLVERRKMGVKNRYKLTREAIFLLETSVDFSRD